MALFGLWKTPFEKRVEKLETDLKLATQREPYSTPGEFQRTVKESRRPGKRDISLGKLQREQSRATRRGTDAEVECVYDLAEVIKLQDIEGYFRVSIDRHVEMIMKNGFRLKGRNPETVDYVKNRLSEIEIISDQPFGDMLRELVRNTVSVHNGLWVLSRDPTRSTGRRIKMWGRQLDPISAITVPDPSTVRVKQTNTGRPYQWVQRIAGHSKVKKWQHHDVIHIPVARKSGYIFGTPYVIPALEDIRALRKLEMLSEHVAHKFAFPFMHWKVGTDQWPAGVTIDPETNLAIADIDAANNYAESMAQEGFVVTSHRHEIAFLGLEGELFDLKPYIQHYEERVLGTLRLSEVDLGRGDTSNRGTAQVMSQVLIDACMEYQDVISQYVTMKLFGILLMEGGYNLNEQNKVLLSWPPINTEEARAKEAHGLNLYVQNVITREECRIDYLERDELTPEEEAGLFLYHHLKPLLDMETEAKIEISKAKPALGAGGGAGGTPVKTKSNGASKRSASNATASNQHGTLPTRPRFPKNDIVEAWYEAADEVIEKIHEGDRTGLGHDLRKQVVGGVQAVARAVRVPMIEEWTDGYSDAASSLNGGPEMSLPRVKDGTLMWKFLEDFHRRDLNRVGTTLMISAGISPKDGRLGAGRSAATVMPAFDTALTLLGTKLDRGFRGARLLGRLQAMSDAGVTDLRLVDSDGGAESVRVQDDRELLGITGNPNLLDREIEVTGNGA